MAGIDEQNILEIAHWLESKRDPIEAARQLREVAKEPLSERVEAGEAMYRALRTIQCRCKKIGDPWPFDIKENFTCGRCAAMQAWEKTR